MFRKIVLAMCAAAALSGCVTAEELEAQDDRDCQSYGASFGSDNYVLCRMVKTRQRKIDQDRAIASVICNSGKMASAFGTAQQQYEGAMTSCL
jgi:hypothetical protein